MDRLKTTDLGLCMQATPSPSREMSLLPSLGSQTHPGGVRKLGQGPRAEPFAQHQGRGTDPRGAAPAVAWALRHLIPVSLRPAEPSAALGAPCQQLSLRTAPWGGLKKPCKRFGISFFGGVSNVSQICEHHRRRERARASEREREADLLASEAHQELPAPELWAATYASEEE